MSLTHVSRSLQWRGRAGIAPDFRMARSRQNCACTVHPAGDDGKQRDASVTQQSDCTARTLRASPCRQPHYLEDVPCAVLPSPPCVSRPSRCCSPLWPSRRTATDSHRSRSAPYSTPLRLHASPSVLTTPRCCSSVAHLCRALPKWRRRTSRWRASGSTRTPASRRGLPPARHWTSCPSRRVPRDALRCRLTSASAMCVSVLMAGAPRFRSSVTRAPLSACSISRAAWWRASVACG